MGRHVFICGYSRSGTTMFYNMLRTTVTNFRFLDIELAARKVIGATQNEYVTKAPLDIFEVDRILAANSFGKDVICIIMVRDFRGVLTSRHASVPNDYFIGFEHQYHVGKTGISYTDPGIAQIHGAVMAVSKRKDLTTVCIRYERLLRKTDVIQAELGRLVGFKYKGGFRDFYKHEPPPKLRRPLNALRPPDPANINAWRAPEHRERIIGHFSRYPQLFKLLRIYGYERDDSWFDAYLRDVLAASS